MNQEGTKLEWVIAFHFRGSVEDLQFGRPPAICSGETSALISALRQNFLAGLTYTMRVHLNERGI